MEVVDIRVMLAPAISLVCAVLVFTTGGSVFWRRFWSLSAAAHQVRARVLDAARLAARRRLHLRRSSSSRPASVWDSEPMRSACSSRWCPRRCGSSRRSTRSATWRASTSRVRFFGFFALCVSTTVGIAFAENMLTLFLFYEMLTICTYPLVIHEETPEAFRAGRKYLAYTLIGGACVLIASAITFRSPGRSRSQRPGSSARRGCGLRPCCSSSRLFIAGFGVKAAIMPLHGWLPSAMVAPTPVSALLHAVAVVKAGAFGILRVIYCVFGVDLLRELGFTQPLAWLAAFTIIAGSLIAIMQDNFKRRLAYSTISQLSYIVLGASLLTPYGATAAIVHIANQAFPKITMFFVAGAIQRKTGKTKISELAGIGHQMPYTMGAFTVAALSFIGRAAVRGVHHQVVPVARRAAGRRVVVRRRDGRSRRCSTPPTGCPSSTWPSSRPPRARCSRSDMLRRSCSCRS